jgi:hypothetical protein
MLAGEELNAAQKSPVLPEAFANTLLRLATRPDDLAVVKAHSQQYRRELLYLRLFSLLYVLEIKAASSQRFKQVLRCYDDGLNRLCDEPGELHLDGDVLESRFDTYAAAVHASAPKTGAKGARNLPYLEVGKQFSNLSGEIADESEIARHAYTFLKYCQSIADFVDQHENELAA